MNCDACKKESQWLEIVGPNFFCHKCISKNKILGLVLRTHADTFKFVIKTLKIKSYDELLKVKREDVEKVADLKKYGIFLKTTNVIEVD